MIAVQAAGQVLQAPPGGLDVIAAIGAGEDRPDPRPLALGELLEDVAPFMHLTPLYQPQWTGQNRPFVDTANPAISGARDER